MDLGQASTPKNASCASLLITTIPALIRAHQAENDLCTPWGARARPTIDISGGFCAKNLP